MVYFRSPFLRDHIDHILRQAPFMLFLTFCHVSSLVFLFFILSPKTYLDACFLRSEKVKHCPLVWPSLRQDMQCVMFSSETGFCASPSGSANEHL